MNSVQTPRKVIGLNSQSQPAFRAPRRNATMEDTTTRLLQLLPRSLDLYEILQTFADELSASVDFGALSFAREDGMVSFATAPQSPHRASYRLEIASQYLGDLVFSRSSPFDNGELIRLESALACLVYPLRNALLYGQAVAAARVDTLTQVGNRAALNDTLDTEMTLADRYGQKLALLMVDIDLFKIVNDTHGHVVGDDVIRTVASTLQGLLRRSDAVFRYGGEEFVVVLRNTDVNGAAFIAERLRRAVECAPVRGLEGLIPVTISTGIAKYEHGQSAVALLERADKALYQAKQTGRNKVCLAD